MNISLGAKIIWRFIIGEPSQWKQILETKYFSSSHQHILVTKIPIKPCSHIWKLIWKALPLIKDNTSGVPGGGKDINLWRDSIMEFPPLSDFQEIHPLNTWMQNKGITILDQISSSNHEDNTGDGWLPPAFPFDPRNQ